MPYSISASPLEPALYDSDLDLPSSVEEEIEITLLSPQPSRLASAASPLVEPGTQNVHLISPPHTYRYADERSTTGPERYPIAYGRFTNG